MEKWTFAGRVLATVGLLRFEKDAIGRDAEVVDGKAWGPTNSGGGAITQLANTQLRDVLFSMYGEQVSQYGDFLLQLYHRI